MTEYTPNQLEGLADRDAWSRLAERKGPVHSTEWWVEYILLLLESHSNSLPSCYKSWEDYLWDFWPDLPWDMKSQIPVIKGILVQADRLAEITGKIREKYGFDMVAELKRGLEE